MSVPYKFLSDEWMDEAKKVREEFAGKGNPPAHAVRMNQIITDVPFGDGTIDAHMDTSGGEMEMDTGHLDNPDLTVTLDYETAKAILVDQNPQAGMQAFMAGKIKVQGDMTKLMAMQSGPVDPTAQEVAARRVHPTAVHECGLAERSPNVIVLSATPVVLLLWRYQAPPRTIPGVCAPLPLQSPTTGMSPGSP